MHEFAVEAIFTQPSYQDLIVTPLGGTLMGLALEPLRDWVKRHRRRRSMIARAEALVCRAQAPARPDAA